MRLIPKEFVLNVNTGYNQLQGFIWPAILSSAPAAGIAIAFPAFRIWAPLPSLVAYAVWIGLQYHFGRISNEQKLKPDYEEAENEFTEGQMNGKPIVEEYHKGIIVGLAMARHNLELERTKERLKRERSDSLPDLKFGASSANKKV